MNDKREPMIGQGDRPSAIDYEAPIADFKLRDLVAVIDAQIEIIKPERYKPEHWKPEWRKPERFKPELTKPEKELLKPEKELSKPEKEFEPGELVEQVAQAVVRVLEERGLIK